MDVGSAVAIAVSGIDDSYYVVICNTAECIGLGIVSAIKNSRVTIHRHAFQRIAFSRRKSNSGIVVIGYGEAVSGYSVVRTAEAEVTAIRRRAVGNGHRNGRGDAGQRIGIRIRRSHRQRTTSSRSGVCPRTGYTVSSAGNSVAIIRNIIQRRGGVFFYPLTVHLFIEVINLRDDGSAASPSSVDYYVINKSLILVGSSIFVFVEGVIDIDYVLGSILIEGKREIFNSVEDVILSVRRLISLVLITINLSANFTAAGLSQIFSFLIVKVVFNSVVNILFRG